MNLRDRSQSTSIPAIGVYYEEFKFLEWVKPHRDEVDFVRVERIDLDLLEVVPTLESESNTYHIRVYFVAKDGSKMMEVQPTQLIRFGKFSFLRPSTWFRQHLPGISVGQALTELGYDRLQNLSHIVVVVSPYVWTRIHIFKLPKSFSLQGWVEGEKQKLRDQIAGEESI